MWAIVAIRAAVKWLFQIFLDAAIWCYESPLNLDWLGDIFADVYFALTDIWYESKELALWFESVEERITDVITESTIFQLLQTWLNYAEDAWNWVLYAFSNVVAIVDVWWSSIIPTVQAWIDIATEGLDSLIVVWDTFWQITFPNWTTELLRIGSELSDFFTTTLPNLLTFEWLGIWWDARLLDINSLIESWTINLAPFWEGWQEIRDSVFEFFTDPLGWLETKFTDWFLGEE